MNSVIPCSKGRECNWPACPLDCTERPGRPHMCEECGVNPADTPSRLCVGCDAYREHTGHF